MKTAIIYYSQHHGNTKKLLDAIAAKEVVTLIDVLENKEADLIAKGHPTGEEIAAAVRFCQSL